jgi:transposase
MPRKPKSSTPEVSAKATRRRFTAAEKARILKEYERGTADERAALFRRERIYSTHIASWRDQRKRGLPLESKRGRKPDPQGVELTKLRKENAQLQQRLDKAERVINVQGKAYELLRAVAGESADELDLPPWNKR